MLSGSGELRPTLVRLSAKDIEQAKMASPVVRRHTAPQVAQQIWAAITYVRSQKQIANTERIMRYMNRQFQFTQSEAKALLHHAVADGLVERYVLVGSKGAKLGVEQEGFKLPEPHDDVNRDEHDWYCFECHIQGEVLECSGCWRVYHANCVQFESGKFLCPICQVSKNKQRIKRKELNRLLSYTVNRLKEKTRDLMKLFHTADEQKLKRFIYQHMDLSKMENKTKNRKYRYMEQFEADAQTIYHNVLICFGQSNLTNTVKVMLQDCKYDIDEIRQCKDCYHFSNAKPKDWFCAPCRPPHELVYAKQKGFSYWPAKVIKITKDGYDVRFFGGWHQRAVVVKANVKPIDTSLRNLNMKKPAASFNKACDEMKRHQKLLAKQAEEDEQEGTTRDSSVKEEPEEEEEEEEEKEAVTEELEAEEEPEEEEEEEEEPKPPKAKRRKVSEADVISSSNTISDRPAPTPEDANLVTSTEDNVQTPRVFSSIDVGTQTSKKLTHSKQPHKGTQTEDTSLGTCSCQSKHGKGFTDKDRPEQQGDKERDLQEITERLRKDSEEDKQQAVVRAVTTTQREAERVRRQTEEQVKEQYMEELKKLAQKHKTEISQTKKKQWCYNCEEEAMYHCCWNTSYCSIKCQQEHWHREHKRCCRRKR